MWYLMKSSVMNNRIHRHLSHDLVQKERKMFETPYTLHSIIFLCIHIYIYIYAYRNYIFSIKLFCELEAQELTNVLGHSQTCR